MKTAVVLFLLEDVFRLGNAQSPRLDHLRECDIPVIAQSGKAVVVPDTGGISVFNQIHPRLRGIWWKCPAGTDYAPELAIVCDQDYQGLRHYLIQPAYPMELHVYQAALQIFAQSFEKVAIEREI